MDELSFSDDHPAYPPALRAVTPRVVALRVRGKIPESFASAVAIVGTRAADEEAIRFTERLARDLATAGIVVVSGGALGVDAAAHRGALEGGGCTIAVLASGFRPPYPQRHAGLFDAIVDAGGALMSAMPDGTGPHRGLFLARNRIVAALSRVVVVTQAPIPSGALSTAAVAEELKIPVMSVPSAPWDVRGQGCLSLLGKGALVCTSARDVLSVSAIEGRAAASREVTHSENVSDFSDLGPVAAQIVRNLGRSRHPDEIANRTGLSAREVQRVLMTLLLEGLVEARPGGRFRKRNPRL